MKNILILIIIGLAVNVCAGDSMCEQKAFLWLKNKIAVNPVMIKKYHGFSDELNQYMNRCMDASDVRSRAKTIEEYKILAREIFSFENHSGIPKQRARALELSMAMMILKAQDYERFVKIGCDLQNDNELCTTLHFELWKNRFTKLYTFWTTEKVKYEAYGTLY